MKPGSPSRTAEYMALFRALESEQPVGRRLFEDRAASSFLRPTLRAVALAARVPLLRSSIVAFIDRRWPGPRLSGVVRTRAIDELVTDAVRDGCAQLVLLGAGYDARATRLPAVASLPVFEVDHPVTQARKRRVAVASTDMFANVPLDFRERRLAACADRRRARHV